MQDRTYLAINKKFRVTGAKGVSATCDSDLESNRRHLCPYVYRIVTPGVFVKSTYTPSSNKIPEPGT
jgi:hypothetical protein